MMDELFGTYDDFFEVKNNLEMGLILLESVLLNGKNECANKYIELAIPEIRRALSYMSDAEFEIHTSPSDVIEG